MKKFKIEIDGEEYIVGVEEMGAENAGSQVSKTPDRPTPVKTAPSSAEVSAPKEEAEMAPSPDVGEGDVLAPMPGSILEINVKKGESVEIGDTLIVLEAMKMENEISADRAGTVKEIKARVGDSVDAEDVLMVIE